jgi:F420-non-reducing hydrogenase large subunit
VRTITIDPLTRLEGHGRVEIFLGEDGRVADAYLQVPELRGFEQFCLGRLAEDMPTITSRICGICPEAHLLASVKALDDLFAVEVATTGRLLRELLYSAFVFADHITHFFALGGPDLIVGPEAPPTDRSLVGVIRTLGAEAGRQVIASRRRSNAVIETLSGRGVHGTGAVPGGWSTPLDETGREVALAAGRENVTFALATLDLFDRLVLQDDRWRETMLAPTYTHHTHSMGTVDEADRLALYDGRIRVVDQRGDQVVAFGARDYTRHVAERVESWTYTTFPYLRTPGWRGFVDGPDSGVYTVGPLARLNAADGMTTPLAQEHFERYHAFFGGTGDSGRPLPVHHRLASHWARLIEALHAAERMVVLATHPEITSPRVRNLPVGDISPEGGVGSVEAPRGTLIHHYRADRNGVLEGVNMIVATTNNHAAMAMSIRRAAAELIDGTKEITEGLLNRVEMALRLYDPCLSCATHTLPGRMPLLVTVRDSTGGVVRELRRDNG